MRGPLVLLLLFAAALLPAQEEKDLAKLFHSISPQITIVVRDHAPTTADDVEITLLDPKYPGELLHKQIAKLGEILQVEPRGLFVGTVALVPNDEKMVFVKGKFSTNGIIEKEKGLLRVEPLLKAFAGAPEPYTLSRFSILFDQETPTTATIRSFRKAGVLEGVGRYADFPQSIEYRVRLETQDPDKITFPDYYTKQEEPKVQPKPVRQELGSMFWVLFSIAGIALVVLVYFALLRAGRPARK